MPPFPVPAPLALRLPLTSRFPEPPVADWKVSEAPLPLVPSGPALNEVALTVRLRAALRRTVPPLPLGELAATVTCALPEPTVRSLPAVSTLTVTLPPAPEPNPFALSASGPAPVTDNAPA